MATVEVRTLKQVDLKGGTIVAAFPSVGLVSTISATFLIQSLPVDQVCALESEDFPSVSMIYARKPKFPARVYADAGHKLAIFVCEMPLPNRIHRPVAYALMDWAKAQGIRRIISLEGFPLEGEGPMEGDPKVWGVGSTDLARKELDTHKVSQLESGMIAGVAGVLLNEGRWRNVDVIALLAEARPDLPDAHAAVSLVHALDELLEDVTVDLRPLQQQARQLEELLTKLKQQAKPIAQKEPPPPPDIYR